MKKLFVIMLMSIFLFTGCKTFLGVTKEDTKIPVVQVEVVKEPTGVVNIPIRTKKSKVSLDREVKNLYDTYNKPLSRTNGFKIDGNDIIVKDLYFMINKKAYVYVNLINDQVQIIITVDGPIPFEDIE